MKTYRVKKVYVLMADSDAEALQQTTDTTAEQADRFTVYTVIEQLSGGEPMKRIEELLAQPHPTAEDWLTPKLRHGTTADEQERDEDDDGL